MICLMLCWYKQCFENWLILQIVVSAVKVGIELEMRICVHALMGDLGVFAKNLLGSPH